MTQKKIINLLPPQAQQQVRLARLNSQVWGFGFWLILSLVVLAAILFVGQILLRQERGATADQVVQQAAVLTSIREQSLKQNVQSFNQDLANFQTLRSSHQDWSKLLVALAGVVPPGVTIDSLTVSRIDKKIELSGRAASRDLVLRLRQNILAAPVFSKVDFPLANLEKARDVPWTYSFYFDATKL